MNDTSDEPDEAGPWGLSQPKFERLECEGPRRFFLVGRLESGEPIRIRLASGRYEKRLPESP